MRMIDISENVYGRLTAVAPTTGRAGGEVIWYCECSCGNDAFVAANKLTSGHTKSCGCYNIHVIKERSTKNVTGQLFGRLIAKRPTDMRSGNKVVWECICSCGKTVFVVVSNLISGNTKSCGCWGVEQSRASFHRNFFKHGLSKTRAYKAAKRTERLAAIKRATTKKIDPAELAAQTKEMGDKCAYCGGPYEHTDHFIPLSRGGKHAIENLVPSCAPCNMSKGAKMPGTEWWPKMWTEQYVVAL